MKIWADLGTLSLSLSGEYPPPLPKMKIWADLGTLSLSWSEEPPPGFLQYVETNHCIPQGYHLLSYVVSPVWIRIDLHALLQQLFKNLTFSQKT